MSKIQVITRQNNGCDFYRCVLPAIYLQKDSEWSKDNSVEMLWIGQDEWEIDCDVLIYNKLIATPIPVLKQMQANGMKIIVDVDDMWELPSWHVYANEWNGKGNDILTLKHIKIADVVTCTSMRLQDIIRQYNKNTVVIPNALPFGDKGYNTDEWIGSYDKTRFLYAGGVSHLPDIRLLEGKFKRIGSDGYIREHSEYILAGYEKAKQLRRIYTNKDDLKAKNEKYTEETVDVTGPYDHMKNIFSYTGSYRVIPSAHVMEYLHCYDHADVVLAPMVDDTWNSYKSVLKVLEAATRNLPIICSNVPPYSDLRPCEGILYVEQPDDWLRYIRKCIKEPQWTKDIGAQTAEWVKEEYNLNKWNTVRKQLIQSL